MAKPKKEYQHTLPPEKLDLRKALHEERHKFQESEVAIITVSATYRKELADKYQSLVHTPSDVVYSRAHYSMAEAVLREAKDRKMKAHLSDPTNFVGEKDWGKIEFTEKVGQLMARHKMLKEIKDKIDIIARSKLPITQAITLPLLYLTDKTPCPVISMHYEAGNILAENGKSVLQVITDPHVRSQYLNPLPSDKIKYAVFDEETREEFLAKANELNKEVIAENVVVTGPPIDERIIKIGKNKKRLGEGPINLAVTTGGLGTNFKEIQEVLEAFVPLLKPPEKIRLFLYAGTHRDFRNWFEDYAAENHIRVGDLDDTEARIRILYDDSIVDANENLIEHMFPWAHGVITKPSGDMAYDAAVAGCFLLFLEPWGEWEENVQKVFVKNGVGYDFRVTAPLAHFKALWASGRLDKSLKKAIKLPEVFRHGTKNILDLHATMPCEIHNY
jgi:hypothetical protein